VYARKRPKLSCESSLEDVLLVDTDHSSICVNEAKSALDGSPILRRNTFTFDKTFDGPLTNDQLFTTSILPFVQRW
jgi:hypothetical protein